MFSGKDEKDRRRDSAKQPASHQVSFLKDGDVFRASAGCHRSADNILDPGPEETTKTTCFHERSRSSPSADIYGQVSHKDCLSSQIEINKLVIKSKI